MGWNAHHQIVTELSPDKRDYQDMTTYVVTHKSKESSDKIRFVNESPADPVKRQREETGKGIRICSGASLIQPPVKENVIDCCYLTVFPTILASGFLKIRTVKSS